MLEGESDDKLNMEYCTDMKTIVFTVMVTTAHSSHSIHLLNGNIIIVTCTYTIIIIQHECNNFGSVNTLI